MLACSCVPAQQPETYAHTHPNPFTMCWFFIIWPGAQIKPDVCKEITPVSMCCCLASTANLHIEASLDGKGVMERHPGSRTVLQIFTNWATFDKKQHKKEEQFYFVQTEYHSGTGILLIVLLILSYWEAWRCVCTWPVQKHLWPQRIREVSCLVLISCLLGCSS